MKASLSRKTSTLSSESIPASSDRAATTLFGQLSQVTPPRLFIMPSTKRVTVDNSFSTAAACDAKDASSGAIKKEKAISHLVFGDRIKSEPSSIIGSQNTDKSQYIICTYYRCKYSSLHIAC